MPANPLKSIRRPLRFERMWPENSDAENFGIIHPPGRQIRRAAACRGTTTLIQSNTMKKLITLALALVCSAAAYAGEFSDISIAELKKAINEKSVTVIDVNGSDSYKAGHIPTAIDFSTNKDTLAKSLPSDKSALVVAYCGGPRCGAYQAAAKKAKELGYTNVKHLSAGISGWKKAGEKTESAAE